MRRKFVEAEGGIRPLTIDGYRGRSEGGGGLPAVIARAVSETTKQLKMVQAWIEIPKEELIVAGIGSKWR
jgi:hypothetical protein